MVIYEDAPRYVEVGGRAKSLLHNDHLGPMWRVYLQDDLRYISGLHLPNGERVLEIE